MSGRGKPKKHKKWEVSFAELVAFKKKHGHLNVSPQEDLALSKWVKNQRVMFRAKKLGDDKIKQLDSIGHYTDLKEYIKQHHELPPSTTQLGRWALTQRQRYDQQRLHVEKRKYLDQLPIAWRIAQIPKTGPLPNTSGGRRKRSAAEVDGEYVGKEKDQKKLKPEAQGFTTTGKEKATNGDYTELFQKQWRKERRRIKQKFKLQLQRRKENESEGQREQPADGQSSPAEFTPLLKKLLSVREENEKKMKKLEGVFAEIAENLSKLTEMYIAECNEMDDGEDEEKEENTQPPSPPPQQTHNVATDPPPFWASSSDFDMMDEDELEAQRLAEEEEERMHAEIEEEAEEEHHGFQVFAAEEKGKGKEKEKESSDDDEEVFDLLG